MIAFLIIGCEKYINDLQFQAKMCRSNFPDAYVIPVIGNVKTMLPGIYNVNSPDDYKSLSLKIRSGMSLILDKLPDVDIIVKIDDDISLDKNQWLLLKTILPHVQPDSYIGGGYGNTNGLQCTDGRNGISSFIHKTKYVYGGLSIFGKKSAKIIIDNTDLRCDLEDVTAGNTLTNHGHIPTSFGFIVSEKRLL